MAYRGRSSRGGSYRPRNKTRRGGTRSKRGRNLRRVGIGLGIAGAGLLAVNAGILGAAGTSRAVKELVGTAKSVGKWAKSRKASKIAAKASTIKFHATRVKRLKVFKSKTFKSRKARLTSPRYRIKR